MTRQQRSQEILDELQQLLVPLGEGKEDVGSWFYLSPQMAEMVVVLLMTAITESLDEEAYADEWTREESTTTPETKRLWAVLLTMFCLPLHQQTAYDDTCLLADGMIAKLEMRGLPVNEQEVKALVCSGTMMNGFMSFMRTVARAVIKDDIDARGMAHLFVERGQGAVKEHQVERLAEALWVREVEDQMVGREMPSFETYADGAQEPCAFAEQEESFRDYWRLRARWLLGQMEGTMPIEPFTSEPVDTNDDDTGEGEGDPSRGAVGDSH